MTAKLVGLNHNTVRLFFHRLREIIAEEHDWHSPFDGEMPVPLMQHRITLQQEVLKLKEHPSLFSILSADAVGGLPDLTKPEGQQRIAENLSGVELLVLDNLSSLCRGGENESTEWQTMQDWLMKLRNRNVTVLLIHHAGKSGTQRGTSRREDVLDVVLKLVRPIDYRPKDGARFEVHVEKARQVWGEQAEPFEAQLYMATDPIHWRRRAAGKGGTPEQRRDAIQALKAQGHTVEEIATRLGIHRATVFRSLGQSEAPALP